MNRTLDGDTTRLALHWTCALEQFDLFAVSTWVSLVSSTNRFYNKTKLSVLEQVDLTWLLTSAVVSSLSSCNQMLVQLGHLCQLIHFEGKRWLVALAKLFPRGCICVLVGH